MGRLLEIARTLPVLTPPPGMPRTTCEISVKSELSSPQAYQKAPLALTAFDPAASAVLGILVQAGQPVPHPAIVVAMAMKGYDKTAARKAIASCQAKGWIEHNLISGYVLAFKDNIEYMEKAEDQENGEQI